MKQYLDKEQIDILKKEIEIKDNILYILKFKGKECLLLKNNEINFHYSFVDKENFSPTLTIGELLERLPEEINGFERVIMENKIGYTRHHKVLADMLRCFAEHEELIDNLFDCYLWYLEIVKNKIIWKKN